MFISFSSFIDVVEKTGKGAEGQLHSFSQSMSKYTDGVEPLATLRENHMKR